MGKLDKNGNFKGMVGNSSLYNRSDMPGTEMIRTHGGPTKRQIKTGKNFKVTRGNISEFGARSTASSWILAAIKDMKPLGDYNHASDLNSLLTTLQRADKASEHGHRSVALTQAPSLLEGFPLSKRNSFDLIVRAPLIVSIDKKALT